MQQHLEAAAVPGALDVDECAPQAYLLRKAELVADCCAVPDLKRVGGPFDLPDVQHVPVFLTQGVE